MTDQEALDALEDLDFTEADKTLQPFIDAIIYVKAILKNRIRRAEEEGW